MKIFLYRREKAKARSGGGAVGRGAAGATQVPDPSDPTAMQAYFLQEVQLGEEFMASGNVEEGAVHIANAIALCGPSQQLLQIFQQTLPAEQYAAVIEQLPHTRARLAAMFGEAADHAESQPPVMTYMGDGPPPAQIKELLDDTDDLE
ncbi:Import receptor subunit [Trichostrongylus colubriformis]|uniref:Mitochondrial import receptor subunit TOM20 homolog n=1 Tax=Trichostrongylus colubriformis TaxID=6319 RepID=A0AAN8FCM5_TRICO